MEAVDMEVMEAAGKWKDAILMPEPQKHPWEPEVPCMIGGHLTPVERPQVVEVTWVDPDQ
jgi:hypothetical protein